MGRGRDHQSLPRGWGWLWLWVAMLPSAVSSIDQEKQTVSTADVAAERRPRIYVGVPMNWPITKESTKINLRSLLETWGSHTDVLRFYVHKGQLEKHPASTLGIEGIEKYLEPIDMRRSDRIEERNIWEKSWRGWMTAAQLYLHDAEWFLKADIDSFLIIENLKAYLAYLRHEEAHYLGHTLMHDWEKFNVVFNSGVGYVLSREALRRYGMRLQFGMPVVEMGAQRFQCFDRPGPVEDPNTAGCLREIGILPGDTLDREGRQRFNLFRPRDLLFNMHYKPDDWYWKNKGSIGKKQMGLGCCSNVPLAWHNFKSGRGVFDKDAFHHLEYVYHTQPYAARLKAIELDPPTGKLFQFNEHELSFQVDSDRNVISDELSPGVRLGHFFVEHPDLKRCNEAGSTCSCKLPNPLPEGFALVDSNDGECVPGGFLAHGAKCEVACPSSKLESVSIFDEIRGTSSRHFQCDGGLLRYPRLKCQSTCRVPSPPRDTLYSPPRSTTMKPGEILTISCAENSHTASATCRANGRFFGNPNLCTGCNRHELRLKGSRYQMESWGTVTYIGATGGAQFSVESVQTGSERDPVKNCDEFDHDTQLVLTVKSGSDSPSSIVAPLSCGNQEIHVISHEEHPAPCESISF